MTKPITYETNDKIIKIAKEALEFYFTLGSRGEMHSNYMVAEEALNKINNNKGNK